MLVLTARHNALRENFLSFIPFIFLSSAKICSRFPIDCAGSAHSSIPYYHSVFLFIALSFFNRQSCEKYLIGEQTKMTQKRICAIFKGLRCLQDVFLFERHGSRIDTRRQFFAHGFDKGFCLRFQSENHNKKIIVFENRIFFG